MDLLLSKHSEDCAVSTEGVLKKYLQFNKNKYLSEKIQAFWTLLNWYIAWENTRSYSQPKEQKAPGVKLACHLLDFTAGLVTRERWTTE